MALKDVLLAVAIAAAWGLNFVVIKVGVDNFPPLLFSALRFTLSALPLVFFVSRPRTGWPVIVGIGLILGVVKFSLLFVGIDAGVSAGLASLVLQSQALFTLLLAALLLGERPSARQLAGIAVAFAGMALVSTTVGSGGALVGLGLVLAAGLAWGCSNIAMRWAGRVRMLDLMVWVSLVPPIPLFLLSAVFEGPAAARAAFVSLTWQGVGAVVYVAFVATILGFAGWGHLISRYGAGQVAPFSLLVPVFGMGSAALLLDEPFGPVRLAGAAIVLAGLVLTVWKRPPRDVIHAPGPAR